ncbi:riboflavin synthase [Bacillus thermotolerans]|uniref:Riboflavin synthase n=1 Tax=Bacillus thermotolerans TaxID=1221996 RepID=A0A0F5HN37_BACTR|nr:riboflavin synthase [Bacillus thermotolerans]KKB34663.1 Riboflavin synthase [Bacillus thermotolerans]KKB35005.1 Riboflavin synthase [Bacillus thermotolerans]KKB38563.1 Riboflavin synthase [Bacillus thermotolerans]
MFTGIIEEIGTVKEVMPATESLELVIAASKVLEDVHLGDSIAINGVCLTVTSFTEDAFTADVMPETFHSTSLSKVRRGSKVNLERAMSANGRFGGHFVSGHVDGVGTVSGKRQVENALYMDITYPSECASYLMPKGSVALDGTSLTIFGVNEKELTISLIPHTQEETILAQKAIGEPVNIECDMLAKYVERMVNRQPEKPSSNITMELLERNGFA